MNGAQLGLALRDAGIESVAAHNEEWLKAMRHHARRICDLHGSVSTDDLQGYAESIGWQPAHHNAWGAVFKEGGWFCVGYQKSERPEAHGRRIAVWAR